MIKSEPLISVLCGMSGDYLSGKYTPKTREDASEKEFSILATMKDFKQRSSYVIKFGIKYGEVWAAFDADGELFIVNVISQNHKNILAVPFWPRECYAQYAMSLIDENIRLNVSIRPIRFIDWVDSFLMGELRKKKLKAALFWNPVLATECLSGRAIACWAGDAWVWNFDKTRLNWLSPKQTGNQAYEKMLKSLYEKPMRASPKGKLP